MSANSATKKTWKTFLPLEGIGLARELPEFQFGNFKLSRLKNEDCHKNVLAQVQQEHNLDLLCLSHSLTGAPEETALCRACPQKTKKTFFKHCLCVRPTTNPKELVNATETSLSIMRDVTALLRFYLYVSCKGKWPVMNLIDSRNLPRYGVIPSVSSTGEIEMTSFHPGLRGYTMRISKKHLSEWFALDFERVTKTVEDRHLGVAVPEFDEIIVAALIWCGEMLAEMELKDCFLRGATALETLSSRIAKRGQITEKFVTIGAGLVGIATKPEILGPTNMPTGPVKKLFRDAKDLFAKAYRLRCNISHGSSGIGGDNSDEMWQSQLMFVSACVGAIFLWQKERTQVGFYKRLEEVISNLSAP